MLYSFLLARFCLFHSHKLYPIILDQHPSPKSTGDELTTSLSTSCAWAAAPIQARMLLLYNGKALHLARSLTLIQCVPCCGSSSRTIETPDTPPRDPPRPPDKPEQTLLGNKRPSTPTPSRPKDSSPSNSPKVQDPLEPTDSGTPKGSTQPTTRPYFDLFPSQRKAPPIAE